MKIRRIIYKYIINSLKKACPERIQKLSEKKAIKIFQKAANYVPFYKDYLKNSCPNYRQIKNIKSFRECVPIMDKNKVFNQNKDKIKNIFLDGNIDDVQSILLSSGHSGTFAFGISFQKEIKKNNQFLELLLDYYFNALGEKTLIINCLPQAVKLPSLDVVIAEIGPRTDSLIYLIKTLSPNFSQTIIVGDNYFIKNSLEGALKDNIDLSALRIHLILGGLYLPENLRSHLGNILKIDLDNNYNTGSIFSSMGISEFGLNLFFESKETVNLRRLAQHTPLLKEKMLDPEFTYLPMFFNYFPQAYFVEEYNKEIVVTNLSSSSKLPLIRYNTEDKGKLIPYESLKDILKDFNSKNLLPPFKSSLALIYGKSEVFSFKDIKIYPQQIQEGLYSDFEVASKTTGYFRLSKDAGVGKLEIQLKKGILPNEHLKEKFKKAALKYINIDFETILYPYQDFPYAMELDYERKFKHI